MCERFTNPEKYIRERLSLRIPCLLNHATQDEIARIRRRKRGRNMLSLETRVSVAAYTTEPDHFLCMLNITETWSCMFPPRFRNTETCDFVLCYDYLINMLYKFRALDCTV